MQPGNWHVCPGLEGSPGMDPGSLHGFKTLGQELAITQLDSNDFKDQ